MPLAAGAVHSNAKRRNSQFVIVNLSTVAYQPRGAVPRRIAPNTVETAAYRLAKVPRKPGRYCANCLAERSIPLQRPVPRREKTCYAHVSWKFRGSRPVKSSADMLPPVSFDLNPARELAKAPAPTPVPSPVATPVAAPADVMPSPVAVVPEPAPAQPIALADVLPANMPPASMSANAAPPLVATRAPVTAPPPIVMPSPVSVPSPDLVIEPMPAVAQ
jgi:hypothetical protein